MTVADIITDLNIRGDTQAINWKNTKEALEGLGTSLTITGGTLADQAHVVTITATQPAVTTANQNAIFFNITSAGSTAKQNRALFVQYNAGYTGAALSQAIQGISGVAGTGTTIIPASGSHVVAGNTGLIGNAAATTTGYNFGVIGLAASGVVNAGLVGLAQIAKDSGTNIGVVGSAINTGASPVMVGGWFSLNQTTPPAISAALIADNASQAFPIILAQVAGTTKWQVEQHGLPVHSAFTISGLPTGVAGMTAYVTDGDAGLAWGATAVNSGPGATKYLVWYNGTNWTVAGK